MPEFHCVRALDRPEGAALGTSEER